MDPFILTLAVFAGILCLIFLRVPIAFALLTGSALGIFLLYSWPEGGAFNPSRGVRPTMSALANVPYAFAHSYELAAIPLYIALGNIAQTAGITSDLFYAMQRALARVRGGLAMASVFGCGGFAALSGSSLACAATMGRIAVPEMRERGYSPALSTGTVAAGGTLGALIPPSVPFILIAILAEQSVGRLLLAGVVPGVLTLISYLIVVAIWVRIAPGAAPADTVSPEAPKRPVILDLMRAWPAALLMAIIIGGLALGLFSSMQAAAVSVAAALLIGLLRRKLTFASLGKAFGDSAIQSAVIFSIAIGANLMITLVAASNLAQGLMTGIEAANLPAWSVMAAIIAILLLLGMFLEPMGIILLMIPITLPIVTELGFEIVWYAVIFVKVIEMGLITPPVGLNVFVLQSVLPKSLGVSLGTIFKGVTAFLMIDFVVLAILLWFPDLSMILPNRM